MYAVIETGGKQYKVSVGDNLKVEKLIAKEGATVKFARVLMVVDGKTVSVDSTPKIKVSAKVLEHGRGDKIRVFKMKRAKTIAALRGIVKIIPKWKSPRLAITKHHHRKKWWRKRQRARKPRVRKP